jgi:hypothetical protein
MSISRRAFGLGCAGLVVASAAPASAAFDLDDLPNVFIAPMGKPFRAKDGAPYPVVDWFKAADKNGDGKLDHAEYMADAGAFFDVLDLNHDGALSSFEVEVYERRVAPEILGLKVVGDLRGARGDGKARLWLAQYGGGVGGGGLGDVPVYTDGKAPGDERPDINEPIPEGAAPFSLLNVPEPLTAADVDFSGVIKKANFLKVADRRFNTLDRNQDGFLVLAKLPKTFVQVRLEKQNRKGFHF